MTREEIEDIIDGLYDAKSDIEGNDISAIRSREDIDKAIKAIEALQSEPVKHGKWINKRLTKDSIKDIKDGTYGELIGYHDVCSICGFDLDKYWHGYKPPYCPNCGAKMEGGANK
jgi:rubrerythrin